MRKGLQQGLATERQLLLRMVCVSVQTLPVIPAGIAGIQSPWTAHLEGGLNAYGLQTLRYGSLGAKRVAA